MLARLDVLLPFSITLPEEEEFSLYQYTDEGYGIKIFPPMKSDSLTTHDDSVEIFINKRSTFQANILRVYFQKDNFDRQSEIECDPPYTVISRTINSFLLKLRFVTRNSKIHPINFPHVSWHLRYLNDDESELETKKVFVRGRAARVFTFSSISLDKDIWNHVFNLSPSYNPPQWDNLLLDANEALPEVGPSIVLVATALEVFISHILNELSKNSSIPEKLWDWINNRNWWLQEPTIEERFDNLLKVLLDISLKENDALWDAFKNIKNARNSFVHEGIAQIGKKPISEDEMKKLLERAKEIIKFVKDKLPENLKWPEYKHSIKVDYRKKIKF